MSALRQKADTLMVTTALFRRWVFPPCPYGTKQRELGARALIEDKDHWCRNHIALDANGVSVLPMCISAVKRCALGALIVAAYDLTHDHDAADHLAYQRYVLIAGLPHSCTSTI